MMKQPQHQQDKATENWVHILGDKLYFRDVIKCFNVPPLQPQLGCAAATLT